MRYIAAIDYEHLDNGMFLTALARSISQQQNTHPIIVHGDSEYTNRIMQTGVMREEAKIRSIKGLNHRLINLFADEGVSAVGINGYQRELITLNGDELAIDASFFERLPEGPALLISTLVWDKATDSPRPVALSKLLTFLHNKLPSKAIYAFNKSEKDEIIISDRPHHMKWEDMDEAFADIHLPDEFKGFNHPLRLTTAREFANLQNEKHAIRID